jgi:hypothetical protein
LTLPKTLELRIGGGTDDIVPSWQETEVEVGNGLGVELLGAEVVLEIRVGEERGQRAGIRPRAEIGQSRGNYRFCSGLGFLKFSRVLKSFVEKLGKSSRVLTVTS